MRCNICLSDRLNWCNIPCGHNVCDKCRELYSSREGFRCQTCLMMFDIELNNAEQLPEPRKGEEGRILFCYQCFQPFTMDAYKNLKHAKHHCQPITKCIQFIQDTVMEKLNKLRICILKYEHQQQMKEQKFTGVLEKIKQYFETVYKALRQKERSLVDEIVTQQQQYSKSAKGKIQPYLENYNKIQLIGQNLEQLAKEEDVAREGCQIIFKPLQDKLYRPRNDLREQQAPKFICINSIDRYLDSSCYLQYGLKGEKQEQGEGRIENKRVNLLSKVNRRLNLV